MERDGGRPPGQGWPLAWARKGSTAVHLIPMLPKHRHQRHTAQVQHRNSSCSLQSAESESVRVAQFRVACFRSG